MSSKKRFTDSCLERGLSQQTVDALCTKLSGDWDWGLRTLSRKTPDDIAKLEEQYGPRLDGAQSLHDSFASQYTVKRRWIPPCPFGEYRGRWEEYREYNTPRITQEASLQEHVAIFPESRWADELRTDHKPMKVAPMRKFETIRLDPKNIRPVKLPR